MNRPMEKPDFSADLSATDWQKIASFRRGVNEFSDIDFEPALQHVADALRSLVDGSHLLVVVARTIGPKDVELDGMRPIFSREFGPRLDRRREVRYRWMTQEPAMHRDPILELAARGVGEPRTIRHRSDVDADAWANAPVRRLLEQLEVEDRLSAIIPLTDHVEVYYIIDRPVGGSLFNAHEASLLLATARGLRPLSARLAWRNGLMPGQRRLESRELDVLDALLGEDSVDELATKMGMSRTAFEQLAAETYDKLVVDGRVELLRTWLQGMPKTFDDAALDTVASDWVLLLIRQAIDDTLTESELTLGSVAKRLGTTSKSVQRALDATDNQFRELADEAREERAKLLLSRPWLNMAEVALQLGYNQVSSLNRAVKRWTNSTPVELRASLLADG